MIKNIVNWTLGGFFRTLGKVLLFLVISLVLGYFLAKSDIKLPLKLIGIQKVDALTTITPSRSNHNVFYSVNRCSYGSFPTCDLIFEEMSESGWLSSNSYTNFCPSGKVCLITRDYYYAKLNTSLSPGLSYTLNFNTWLSNRESESFYRNVTYQMLASNTGEYNGSSSSFIQSFSCRAGIEEGTTSKVSWSCSFVPSTQINYIYLRMFFPSASVNFFSYGINTGSILYDNAQIDAINNQTNIIIDQTTNIDNSINELNDNLMDDNVDESNNSFANFVENFDPPLDGLISDLVTLPLNLLTTLIDGSSTSDLCTTWRNKHICLPNGQLVWGRNNASVNAFKLFFMLAVGGSIAYKCIRGLVKTMEITLDPTQNGVEVMKL